MDTRYDIRIRVKTMWSVLHTARDTERDGVLAAGGSRSPRRPQPGFIVWRLI
jgi:hypothetical protein